MITNCCLSNTIEYDWTDRKHLGPPTMAISDILGGTSLFSGLFITFLPLWAYFFAQAMELYGDMRSGHGLGESLASANGGNSSIFPGRRRLLKPALSGPI